MCNLNIVHKKHKTHENHRHNFKIFQCSLERLCLFAITIHFTSCGGYCEATRLPPSNDKTESFKDVIPDVNSPNNGKYDSDTSGITVPRDTGGIGDIVHCDDDGCTVRIASSRQALEKMASVSRYLFENYANSNGTKKLMDENDLARLLSDLRMQKQTAADDNNIYDQGQNYNETNEDMEQNYTLKASGDWKDREIKYPCYETVGHLTKAYFQSANGDVQLNFVNFIVLLPQIVLDTTRPECEDQNDESHDGERRKGIEHNTRNIWLISFASVTVISLVSLLGVLTIPILRYSRLLNHVIAFLVALAVGTLAGDALLHLLPRAAGIHNHNTEHGDDHFDFFWKGVVACAGIYFFYLLETILGFIHRRKEKKHAHDADSECDEENADRACDDNPSLAAGMSNASNSQASPSQRLLLATEVKENELNLVTLVGEDICQHGEHDAKPDGRHVMIGFEEPLDTGHHHHHSHEVPKSIASLAWMVIVGDGMHNITDGLAIGAAFTNSIGAGLGTVLAIFFHEIPQELADFAVLLDAGMSVKQALFWNFLSACTCFVGLVIGLVVGEFTTGIILWILAFTGGGFLYIAMVDMLPALMKQLELKGCKLRYLIQNLGLLSGFGIMILIGLHEDSFDNVF